MTPLYYKYIFRTVENGGHGLRFSEPETLNADNLEDIRDFIIGNNRKYIREYTLIHGNYTMIHPSNIAGCIELYEVIPVYGYDCLSKVEDWIEEAQSNIINAALDEVRKRDQQKLNAVLAEERKLYEKLKEKFEGK